MTTMVPFRTKVLVKITEALQTITEANGYCNNMAEAVFRGRATYGSTDPDTMISIIEDPRERDILEGIDGSGTSADDWRLLVQGFVADDAENPTDPAYVLSAESRKILVELKAERHNLLGLGESKPCVRSMEIGDPIVRPADEFSTKAYFWIPLTLKLVEDLNNPFT